MGRNFRFRFEKNTSENVGQRDIRKLIERVIGTNINTNVTKLCSESSNGEGGCPVAVTRRRYFLKDELGESCRFT